MGEHAGEDYVPELGDRVPAALDPARRELLQFTMHDDDSVELVSDPIQPYFDDEGDVEVRFRAALVDYFVALCRQASRR